MKIIYWSGTGNTEEMAKLIAKGIETAGLTAELLNVDGVDASIIENEKAFILGCPSMGDEVLEESEFEPFIESIESLVIGKEIALFGSYGWGDGQWMRDFEERLTNLGANIALDPVIANYTPEGESEDECIELGNAFATANK